MLIYISHPYGGKEENAKEVEKIITRLTAEHPEHTFVSPIHAFGFLYNKIPYEQGMEMCIELLSCCEIMFVYGDWPLSRGCREEVNFCKECNIEWHDFPTIPTVLSIGIDSEGN